MAVLCLSQFPSEAWTGMGTRVPAAACSWQGGFNLLVATAMPFLAANSSFLHSFELPGTLLIFLRSGFCNFQHEG